MAEEENKEILLFGSMAVHRPHARVMLRVLGKVIFNLTRDTLKVLEFVPHPDPRRTKESFQFTGPLSQMRVAAQDILRGSVWGCVDQTGRDYPNPAAHPRHRALRKQHS